MKPSKRSSSFSNWRSLLLQDRRVRLGRHPSTLDHGITPDRCGRGSTSRSLIWRAHQDSQVEVELFDAMGANQFLLDGSFYNSGSVCLLGLGHVEVICEQQREKYILSFHIIHSYLFICYLTITIHSQNNYCGKIKAK